MPPASPLVKIHEDRITRLEDDVTECRVDLGVVKSQVIDLRDQVADGIAMLSQKLDTFSAIDDRLAVLETNQRVETQVLAERLGRRSRRIKIIGLLFAGMGAVSAVLGKILFGG